MAHDATRVRGLLTQALRYYGVAAAVAVFYIALFAVGLSLGWHYLLAILCAQVVTIAVAFPTYRAFVFQSQGRLLNDFVRFLSVWISGAIAGIGVTPLLVEVIGLHPLVAQVIAVGVVSLASFAGHRWFSFRSESAESPAHAKSSVSRPERQV